MLIQIGIGVVSGLVTWLVLERVRSMRTAVWQRRLRAVFGDDINSESKLHLVYAEFALMMHPEHAETGTILKHLYVKPNEVNPTQTFSIDRPISSCELRAVRYIAESIGRQTRCTPLLSSDLDVKEKLDISFIALGGPGSNYKTREILENDANNLIRFNGQRFYANGTDNPLPNLERGYDYGMILKLHPTQFITRTWITCAGIGEWGTSGSAWYLANKWREIQKWAGNKSFVLLVRVKPTIDESAEEIYNMQVTQ